MNLSPGWLPILQAAGRCAMHWSTIGAPDACDAEIFAYAAQQDLILVTRDLDFGALLTRKNVAKPSILQIRHEHFGPARFGDYY